MILGKINTLTANRKTDNGFYLIDEKENEVLLPNKYVEENLKIGDSLAVFIYKDSEDRIVATTATPTIKRHEFAYLKVKDVNKYGAFLDWGLDKDLLVPFFEQKQKMEAGKSYVVYLYLDQETDRLVASSKIDDFIEDEDIDLIEDQEVSLIVTKKTDLGFKVIIDHLFEGLIYHNEIFQSIQIGDSLTGFVKPLREDGKIDIILQKLGYKNVNEPNSILILDKIKANNGFLGLNDKSSPEAIYNEIGLSKKAFKKAIGGLYKQKLILIEKNGLYLTKS
ncbi:MAG: S1-like domain-containing RNA-binding protein [Flavobacteriales bacterium]|jgi:predicted RNA-binding protein (virulence factor B family)|nr:S1-like domain-containing RNA-binding protein [Flavobacteriales bacterium]